MDSERLVRGTVSRWFPEQGWGVLASPQVPGTVFAHISVIRDQSGYRVLEEGQAVAFTWAEGGQDGCDHRAVNVYSGGRPATVEATPEGSRSAAYTSELSIEFDNHPDRPA